MKVISAKNDYGYTGIQDPKDEGSSSKSKYLYAFYTFKDIFSPSLL